MSNVVIQVENVSKQYRLGQVGTGTLSHDFNRWLYKLRGKEDPYLMIGEENDRSKKGVSDYVWALKDISFDVNHGEVLGIIGRNGAGKSTLLKILSRTTAPTTGHVKIKGKIASLLEVGTGFHPELSGRENIFLNGAIMGMSKSEISLKLEEIIDFSGVERYIDTPVKRYSSGMYVRLAFAVAAHLDPDILIIDEVLAVGDFEFQQKCLSKIDSLSKVQGKTVLFVTHQMNAVLAFCTRALIIQNGKVVTSSSNVEELVYQYTHLNSIKNETDYFWELNAHNHTARKEVQLNKMWLTNGQGELINASFQRSIGSLHLNLSLEVQEVNSLLTIGFELLQLENRKEVSLFRSLHTDLDKIEVLQTGSYLFSIGLPLSFLNEGEYIIRFIAGVHYQHWIYSPEMGNDCQFCFTIKGGLSESPYWIEKRPGFLAPALSWNKRKIENV